MVLAGSILSATTLRLFGLIVISFANATQILQSKLVNGPNLTDSTPTHVVVVEDVTLTDGLAEVGVAVTSIIAVILCYFLIFTWLAVVRTINQLTRASKGSCWFERVLESTATSCVYLAPMLCAVFFAVSKRAQTLSAGSPFLYHLPPVWLQRLIGTCATAFCMQTATFMMAEFSSVQGTEVPGVNGSSILQTPLQVKTVRFWRCACNVCTAVLYMVLVCILVGLVTMREPRQLIDSIGQIPIHVGTTCTIILAIAYVLVYLAVHIYQNHDSAMPGRGPVFGLEVLKLAAVSVNFSPMLCMLFLGTQIAIDWDRAVMTHSLAMWIETCAASVLIQLALVVVAPTLANAELQVVGPRGEVHFVTQNHNVFILFGILRWLAMSVMYVGVAIISETLWWANVIPYMTHGLYRFVVIYFFAYLALWVAITGRQLSEGRFTRAVRLLTIAKDTVVFCPMLFAVYLESCERAHHIINKNGEQGQPQSNVQDAMMIAAVAQVVQLISVCCAGLSDCPPPKDESVQRALFPPFFLLLFNCAMIVLYGCIVVVVVGLFTANRRNTTGEGTWFA
eukprot:TRINITY_DN75189_c0_g1_i1.p1 TRINITY_DN75189_c0_g1~~TRINITY_DN75189_c0_g1_i1.p1  ORF type:complete len:589 (-),score=58.95 TRINITY_DN75189_c0_g1_i1:12-1703(-)